MSYGSVCPKGEWKDRFLAGIKGSHNPALVHFTSNLGYPDFLTLLKLSQVHVYLTYPLVQNWNLLETISTACAISDSAKTRIQEVIRCRS